MPTHSAMSIYVSCIDEDAKDTTPLLQNLKDLADKKLGANNWLVWDR